MQCTTSQLSSVHINSIPTGQGRNQPLYERHVTKSGRNRVKPFSEKQTTGPKSLLFKHIYTVLMLQLQYNCVCSQSDGRNWIWRERSKDRCIWPTSKAIHPLCSAPTPPAHRRAAAGTAAGLPPPLHSSRRHRRRRHTALL